jgi:cold shock CspA family protein
MAGIEARQLAVGDQVQAGQFLRFEDDHHGVSQDEARRISDEPGWDRITSDDGCLDAFTHLCAHAKSGKRLRGGNELWFELFSRATGARRV